MPKNYRLTPVDPHDVDFSDFNPRGESSSAIQRDPEFERLKDSVYRYGVLVPIVVHEQSGTGKRYKLVDGERRLRAALLTGVEKIPAHIAPAKGQTDDILQAFHIHMLRKQWKPLAQARALKRIIDGLAEKGKPADEESLLEELRSQTACGEGRLKALRRAIRFPAAVLKAVDRGELNWSHLVQIEESFMEQLSSVFPDLLKEIGEKRARHVLVEKAQRGVLTSTRALMLNVAPVVNRARNGGNPERQLAAELLKRFLDDPDMPAELVLKEYESAYPESGRDTVKVGESVVDVASQATGLLAQLRPDDLAGFPVLAQQLRRSLEQLRTSLVKVLREMKRRGL